MGSFSSFADKSFHQSIRLDGSTQAGLQSLCGRDRSGVPIEFGPPRFAQRSHHEDFLTLGTDTHLGCNFIILSQQIPGSPTDEDVERRQAVIDGGTDHLVLLSNIYGLVSSLVPTRDLFWQKWDRCAVTEP